MNDSAEGIAGVILDLDGTLVDSPAAISAITADVLREMGHACDEQMIRSSVGKPLEQNFAGFLGVSVDHPDVGVATAAYRKRFGAHVKAVGSGLLYPGVSEGLARLRQAGLRLGIATSKTHEAAMKTIGATGIAHAFEAVVGHDDVPEGKPAPDMAMLAAKSLDLDAPACVSVGDAIGDMRMGVGAGMVNIGVGYGVASEDELREAGADVVLSDFPAVVEEILRLAGVRGEAS